MERNRDALLRIEAAQDKCRGCTGDCKKSGSMSGMIPVVVCTDGRFSEAVQICRHERARREQMKIDRLFASAGVPPIYAQDTFADYIVTPENEAAVRAAKWLVGDDAGGAFIYGERGTGKTKLAAIIANEKLRRGKPVLFTSAPDLMADIRATFDGGNTEETLAAVRDTPCLILDDLGAEKPTGWVAEQLFVIINHRYNKRLQTIVTSNYDKGELIRRLAIRDRRGNIIDDVPGQRVMSRIYGMCRRVRLGGGDWRMKERGAA